MPELILETGEGLENSNSYVSVAEADEYHDTELHSLGWPVGGGGAELTKVRALITATRILDQQWRWFGYRSSVEQALQWPRNGVRDPDLPHRQFIHSDIIPAFLKRATAALALKVIERNPETPTTGQGVSSFSLDGVFSVSFDLSTAEGVLPDWLMAELLKYGSPFGGMRTVKLVRT
jgi:hypothetical protein